jgi:hypothetical protein
MCCEQVAVEQLQAAKALEDDMSYMEVRGRAAGSEGLLIICVHRWKLCMK